MRCITSSRRLRAAAGLPALVLASVLSLVQVGDAAPVTVRFAEGNLRGLLVIRSATGGTIGHGELTQVLRGDLVESRTLLTLHDGSLHDETVVFSQRGVRGATASGHMLAFTPWPRLLHAVLAPEGEDTVLLGDAPRKAARYLVSLEIGGVVGTLASLVGKSPPDLRYWILGGEMPVFVRFEGALSLNGPVWRIEQTTVRWP